MMNPPFLFSNISFTNKRGVSTNNKILANLFFDLYQISYSHRTLVVPSTHKTELYISFKELINQPTKH